jgi:hypothetical protein
VDINDQRDLVPVDLEVEDLAGFEFQAKAMRVEVAIAGLGL